MSFLRVAAIRSSPATLLGRSATRAVRRTTSQPCMRIGQQSGRRGYASATDAVKKTSDLPWAATATVVTAVGLYIALSPTEGGAHAHDTHHEGHGKEYGSDHKEEAAEEPKEEEVKEESKDEPAESKEESKDESEEKPAEDKAESKEEEKPSKDEESKDDSKPSDEGKKGDEGKTEDDTNASEDQGTKGDTQKGATKQQHDVKHREEDAGKGAVKVRMDSPASKNIGEGSSAGEGDHYAKTAQKGISNTDTRHSTDPHADPGKSSKGEGTAETAKIKGTVKPDRPQV